MNGLATIEQPPLRVFDAWQHQLEAYQFADPRRWTMLAMDMGTGKSKTTIDLAANSDARKILVLAPKSVLAVWRREFARHWPAAAGEIEVLILDKGTVAKNAQRVATFLSLPSTRRRIVVINYESAWRNPMGPLLESIGFDLVVSDESHRIKAPGGKASWHMKRLGANCGRRLCLTGTPMGHSPLDLYGQFRFLDPRVFGTSFVRFRARYAIMHQTFRSKVLAWQNLSELKAIFHSHSYVCSADDVLDLPPLHHIRRDFVLSPAAARVYNDLERQLVAEVNGTAIIVPNALVKLLRLQQVTSGFVSYRDDAEETVATELARDKADLLRDVLGDLAIRDETDPEKHRPVVVFARFTHDLTAIRGVVESLGLRYGELSANRRDAIDDHACMAPDVDVAGVQIQSGGVGIDLTRASLGVYYSIGFSLTDYLQSLKRLHRPGQERPTRFIHLVARSTVDEAVHVALDRKLDLVESVLQTLKGKK